MENKNNIPSAFAKIGDVTEPSTATDGSVRLRGVTVALDTDVGQAFIADCARNIEGLISDLEIKAKYELSDADWEQLASNVPLAPWGSRRARASHP